MPVGWWHQVKGLDVTIAISFTNFIFPNEYSYQNPNIKSSSNQNYTSSQQKNIPSKTVSQDIKITSQPLTNEIVETTVPHYSGSCCNEVQWQ